jgi:hypothetical protein
MGTLALINCNSSLYEWVYKPASGPFSALYSSKACALEEQTIYPPNKNDHFAPEKTLWLYESFDLRG